ncbi:MAG: 50S ribosomal protein L29 [Spirochaetes bacterium]|nr:50S ribosomal protein L29 [Spirochaetota bacterium]
MAKESVKELSLKELEEKLRDYQEEIRNLRFQSVTGQVQNIKRRWFVRKRIAQIKTLLHENKLGLRKLPEAGTLKKETEPVKEKISKKEIKAKEKKANKEKKKLEKKAKKEKNKKEKKEKNK